MVNHSLLPRNLKSLLQPNYDWIISHGESQSTAANKINDLRSILNSIVAFKYTEVRKYIQIRRELGESTMYLNSRILCARQFAKFLQENNYSVDAQLLDYPVYSASP